MHAAKCSDIEQPTHCRGAVISNGKAGCGRTYQIINSVYGESPGNGECPGSEYSRRRSSQDVATVHHERCNRLACAVQVVLPLVDDHVARIRNLVRCHIAQESTVDFDVPRHSRRSSRFIQQNKHVFTEAADAADAEEHGELASIGVCDRIRRAAADLERPSRIISGARRANIEAGACDCTID